MAAHCDGCSCTMRTARSRISGRFKVITGLVVLMNQ